MGREDPTEFVQIYIYSSNMLFVSLPVNRYFFIKHLNTLIKVLNKAF